MSQSPRPSTPSAAAPAAAPPAAVGADLEKTVRQLLAPGRGILAADESTGTIAKRFAAINVANTEETRRAYREMLFTTPGMAEFISGVILYEETLTQKSAGGEPFPRLLEGLGVVPGIKVDKGTVPLPGAPGEVVTQGLDGLAERLAAYRQAGARFAKWRAVLTIAPGLPTRRCLQANAHALARYAAICQEGGVVPIVEPEVLMDGDHTLARCAEVTAETLHEVFVALHDQGVRLEEILLKPNMVVSGAKGAVQASVPEVAEATLRVFRRVVPAAVPGIVFLSGGQTDEMATAHLNAINASGPAPWIFSFSYGRALQAPSLKAWAGQATKAKAGQAAFLHRARLNGAAAQGAYHPGLETSHA
jgi:fructose-bisphosphate aldolase, class I